MWWIFLLVLFLFLVGAITLVVPISQRRLRAVLLLVQYIAIVAITAVLIYIVGLFAGISIAFALTVSAIVVSRISFVHNTSQRLFGRYHSAVSHRMASAQVLDYLVDRQTVGDHTGGSSYEELHEFIQSARVLSKPEKNIMFSAIGAHNKTIEGHVVSLSKIEKVVLTDSIGPLLLDELHQSKYKVYPVVNDDDSIVGSITFSTLMNRQSLAKIPEMIDQSLMQVTSHDKIIDVIHQMTDQHVLMAVVTDAKEPSVVMLKDLVEAILGKRDS